jgi:hypothetical protein
MTVKGRSCKSDVTAHLDTPLLAPAKRLYLYQHPSALRTDPSSSYGITIPIRTDTLNNEHDENNFRIYLRLRVLFIIMKSGKIEVLDMACTDLVLIPHHETFTCTLQNKSSGRANRLPLWKTVFCLAV